MQRDAAFAECGTAVAACLVQPGSVSVAWAGDCRAVLGLSVGRGQGPPRCLVHALTRDHKPSSPLEQRRILASGVGQVVAAGEGGRIAARRGARNSLSLSRGFGDTWAVPLGFTAEPDAVTLSLPTASSPAAAAAAAAAPGACPSRRHVLLVCCDGVWDQLSSGEAVAIASACPSAHQAALAVVQAARARWAAAYRGEEADDITALVAFLPC